jgi:hypothetical protein
MYLHVWGLTEKDANRAHEEAMAKLGTRLTAEGDVEIVRTVGNPCPFGRNDPNAIAQGVSYQRAWALYETNRTNEGSQP